ncbi:DUF485 domain-containing protein [Nonomuraea sp. NPDC050790]|uniref:DUF485 domain-containing protein n=1 Tax=Nonomuraea sp. NPDC050790 TaxID=3364371 RepID=UPI00378CD3B8
MVGEARHRGAQAPRGWYAGLAQDRRFRLLRTRFYRLAIGIVASFLGWYFLYIWLSAFAREFMARPVVGHINVALLLGVLQFVSTFALAWRYSRYARRMLDPLSEQLREEAAAMEAEREHADRLAAERRRIESWAPPRRTAAHRRTRGGRP